MDDRTRAPIGSINLGRLFTARTRGQEEERALVDLTSPDSPRTYTFSELNDRANQVANAFRERGLEPGDRWGAVLDNSAAFYQALFGAAKAGVVLVPFNTRVPAPDIGDQMRRAEVSGVFSDAVHLEKSRTAMDELRDDVPLYVTPVEKPVPTEEQSFEEFRSGHSTTQPEVDVGDHDILQIMFTSGTTGTPKGVKLSHQNLFTAHLQYPLSMPNFDNGDTDVQFLPLYHGAAQFSTLGAWYNQSNVVLGRRWETPAVVQAIEEYGGTHMHAASSLVKQLFTFADEKGNELQSLKSVLYGLSPLPVSMREWIMDEFDVQLSLASGQTECTGGCVWFYPKYQLTKEGNYWGVSTSINETALLDDDGELIESPDQTGEIAYRGPSVMEGLLDQEREADVFDNGWLRSGDLGVYDEDGLIKFVDRKKDVIKSGGENVSSVRVEDVLLAHPAVEEAAVVGLPHPRWSEAVTGFVVPSATIDEDDIIEHCSARLAGFEVPKRIIEVDELPLTPTAKVQKHSLREAFTGLYSSGE